MHAQTKWLDCGEGTLLDPVTKNPITTRVVELEGFGRVFEVYDYSNEPAENFRLILAAPHLLAALEKVTAYFDAIDAMQPEKKHGTVGDSVRSKARAAIAKAKCTL